jgi:membrane protease YdiL (CAAX protease family)
MKAKLVAVAELVIVALIFVADAHHLIPLSKTIPLVLLGWLSLRLRKLRWRDVGLTLYRSWKRSIALGLALGVALEALELFVTQPLLIRVLHKKPELDLFRALHGNIKWTLIAIAGAWTLAAFGEEMVYRGYLMNRVADLFDRTPAAWIVSLLIVHVGFGLAHAYQGITGILDEALMGFILGIAYLRCGRSLAVPIIAHGLSDTIDLVLIYCGKYPTM